MSGLHFVLASGWEEGIADLTHCLVDRLRQGQKVLWLLSGGSNIAASVEVMNSVTPSLSQGLSVMLIDERYGPEGHADSNWTQLIGEGFQPKQATTLPVLKDHDSFQQTLARYGKITKQAFASHDLIVGQLGIGADGHIAGILPESPAAAEKTELVAGYEDKKFTRLTLTFPALRRLDKAYVFAFGLTKRQAMETLRDKKLPLVEQPAQILKQLSAACVYNDVVES